jgi:hypothetical protein
MNVLVIPEDAKYGRHVLQPLMERMITSWLGLNARIDARPLGGSAEATEPERLREVVDQYKMVDLFILCLDQDDRSNEWAEDQIAEIEETMRGHLGEEERPDDAFFTIVARREIEAWVLIGCEESGDWTYTELCQDPQVKKRYFEPYAEERGVHEGQFGGRKPLGKEAARNYRTIRQECEELKDLEDKIQSWRDA